MHHCVSLAPYFSQMTQSFTSVNTLLTYHSKGLINVTSPVGHASWYTPSAGGCPAIPPLGNGRACGNPRPARQESKTLYLFQTPQVSLPQTLRSFDQVQGHRRAGLHRANTPDTPPRDDSHQLECRSYGSIGN